MCILYMCAYVIVCIMSVCMCCMYTCVCACVHVLVFDKRTVRLNLGSTLHSIKELLTLSVLMVLWSFRSLMKRSASEHLELRRTV